VAGSISASALVNADISASAAIADTKLATISTASKVSNSANVLLNGATSANTASTLVLRDGSGGFIAGAITHTLIKGSVTSQSVATDFNIDFNSGNYHYITLSGNAILTPTNVPATGGTAINIIIFASGGARTLTLNTSSIKTPGNVSAFTISSGMRAIVSLVSMWEGENTVYGTCLVDCQ
jgi:hypothetical protein